MTAVSVCYDLAEFSFDDAKKKKKKTTLTTYPEYAEKIEQDTEVPAVDDPIPSASVELNKYVVVLYDD